MNGYNIDIADMQCSVFRMAQSKWKMSPSDCALFDFDSEIWKESSYLLSLYDYCTSKKLCASGSSPHSKMLHSALFNYHFFQLLFLVVLCVHPQFLQSVLQIPHRPAQTDQPVPVHSQWPSSH